MENQTKDIEIVATDDYAEKCLRDSLNRREDSERRPKGMVKIFEVDENGSKKLVHKSNLIVYLGREWLAQAIVRTNNPNVDSTGNEFISWMGLGTGGVDSADPLNPIAPIITDTDLYAEAPLNNSDATYADFRGANYYKKPFDSVAFEQDVLNDDKWLVVRITTTITVGDANGYNLSEAGLFTASSSVGGHSGPFHLFARVTFPSIVKTEDRRLIIVWYLFV
jgi:hypothetical protein